MRNLKDKQLTKFIFKWKSHCKFSRQIDRKRRKEKNEEDWQDLNWNTCIIALAIQFQFLEESSFLLPLSSSLTLLYDLLGLVVMPFVQKTRVVHLGNPSSCLAEVEMKMVKM